MSAYDALRAPIRIGDFEVRNRIMMATHGPRLPQPRYLGYLEARAKGGVGLFGVNIGFLGISNFPFGPGAAVPGHEMDADAVTPHPLTSQGRIYYDGLVPIVRAWAQAVQRHGARCIGQLYHPGAARHGDNLQPAIAPSPRADEFEGVIPHALDRDEIGSLVEAYGDCARRAAKAGLDAVELHAAHGYLIHQFLSPLTNARRDEFGGALEGRMRFLMMVIAAIGGAIPFGLRINGPDRRDNGLSDAEIVAVASAAVEAGAAYVSVSGGTYAGLLDGANLPYVAAGFVKAPPNVEMAAAIRAKVDVPVMVAGRITDLAQANEIIRAGKADVVGIVRGLIADPQMVEKAFSGKAATTIPCIACNECHYGRIVACPTNPMVGWEIAPTPRAPSAKRVVIVGAGPAGIQCAIGAAQRGHAPILVEREKSIGGFVRQLATMTDQAEYGRYLDYASGRLKELNIDLRLGVDADPEFVLTLSPDVVVLATGARSGPMASSGTVLVDGGLDSHLAPLIAADFLNRQGCKVVLATRHLGLGESVEAAARVILLKRLQNVEILSAVNVERLEGKTATFRNVLTGDATRRDGIDHWLKIDDRRPETALQILKGQVPELHLIGDALAPRRMLHAALEGARLARSI